MSFFRYYAVVAGCFLAIMAASLAVLSFGVFFNPVAAQFGWTHAETSGAFSLMTIVGGVVGILAGRLGDKFGPRRVIILCGIFEGLGFLLLSQINSLWQFYIYYGILAGIGLACLPPLLSLVTQYYARKRGVMTGFALAGSGVGGIIAPPLTLYIISSFGWQTSYLIMGSIVLAIVAVSALCLYYSRVRQPADSEMPSVKRGISEIKGLSLREATRTGSFWILGIIIFCFGFVSQALSVHLVPGANDLGVSTAAAAGVLSVINLAVMVSSFSTGVVVDRIGSFWSMAIALSLGLVGLLLLLGIRDLWALYVFAILFGVGWGMIAISRTVIIADLFGLSSHGAINGASLFFFTVGACLGPISAGYIYDLTQHYGLALILLTAIALVSLVLTIPMRLKAKRIKAVNS